MLQDLDKIGLDYVDLPDDFVRIIEIPLFMKKSIKEFQGRRPENIVSGGGHHFAHEVVFKKFRPVSI
jgi:hypothetical protein